jgi:hypothetical protein
MPSLQLLLSELLKDNSNQGRIILRHGTRSFLGEPRAIQTLRKYPSVSETLTFNSVFTIPSPVGYPRLFIQYFIGLYT